MSFTNIEKIVTLVIRHSEYKKKSYPVRFFYYHIIDLFFAAKNVHMMPLVLN